METITAARLLAALGQETRLGIFRLLVEAGPAGRCASEIAAALGLAPATLSFHLAQLERTGLIAARKEGRFIRYAAAYTTMDALLAFLTAKCCMGTTGQETACLPQTQANLDERRETDDGA